MTQPYALFLADILEDAGKPADIADKAALELRRQHKENEALTAANEQFGKRQEWWNEKMFALEAQRDALLEALRDATKTIEHLGYPLAAIERARAAIAKAEEKQ